MSKDERAHEPGESISEKAGYSMEAESNIRIGSHGAGARGLCVYYDGACPLCSREIQFYRGRQGSEAIDWVDVSASNDAAIAPDLTRAQAMDRFHVRLPNGELASGAHGFGELWSALPEFRWLGRIALNRVVQPPLEVAYRGFLRIRPFLQRLPATKAEDSSSHPAWLERELRSDHAGETGAVAIYRGVLAVSRDAEVRAFARHHLETERRHLEVMRELVPRKRRSWLIPLWYVAGFLTGALPALFGRRAVYASIDAVETFVDDHYGQQIDRLEGQQEWAALRDTLIACREDELSHRDEARRLTTGEHGFVQRQWLKAIASGSAYGVAVARRL